LDKILAADLIVTVCPIWWGTVPAMLKGYFDRVLVAGTCWGLENGAPSGLLKGKKALNIYSVGVGEDMYAKVTYYTNSRAKLKDKPSRTEFNMFHSQ
jgi:NAD(P)H dehydrogenase (quinone)